MSARVIARTTSETGVSSPEKALTIGMERRATASACETASVLGRISANMSVMSVSAKVARLSELAPKSVVAISVASAVE